MEYTKVLSYIKANKHKYMGTTLIDGMPEAVSLALTIVSLVYQRDLITVINDYADITL